MGTHTRTAECPGYARLALLKAAVGNWRCWRSTPGRFDDVIGMVREGGFFLDGHGHLAVRLVVLASADEIWGSAPRFFHSSSRMMPAVGVDVLEPGHAIPHLGRL